MKRYLNTNQLNLAKFHIDNSDNIHYNNDHYHYYNGKVPFDALFSEEPLMKAPNYQPKDQDIVS